MHMYRNEGGKGAGFLGIWGKGILAEETANVKALRWKCTWCAQGHPGSQFGWSRVSKGESNRSWSQRGNEGRWWTTLQASVGTWKRSAWLEITFEESLWLLYWKETMALGGLDQSGASGFSRKGLESLYIWKWSQQILQKDHMSGSKE